MSKPYNQYLILGEDRGFAELRAREWKQQYGAVAPIISTDNRGKSAAECWSGPPQGWNQKTAVQFARDLLPAKVRNKAAESVERDGHMKILRLAGGYRITLSGMGERVFDVGVYTPEWEGPDC